MLYWLIKFINNYRQYVILALLILFSLFLLTLNDSNRITNLRKLSFVVYGLIDYLKSPLDDFFYYKKENERLRRENTELTKELLELKKYDIERDELYNLLNFKKTNSASFITSRIVLKSVDVVGTKFVLDKGAEDGVHVNSIVLTPSGLVGYVSDLSDHYSIVHSIANYNVRISVINQRTGAIGILSWDGEKFKVYNVNKSSDVKEGDIFTTSQFSSQFPSGIPVLKVTSAFRETELLFYDITGTPTSDLVRINYCIIMKPNQFNEKINFTFEK
ncbi:MAG: rod shape-determining protein MreC [Ignavibacteria bacterium]|nr:rod shape-determining protein MreC [Ignavibacteria bacterium]